jgi:hypothetical protein
MLKFKSAKLLYHTHYHFVIFFLFTVFSFSQTKIDSLKCILKNQNDNERLNTYIILSYAYIGVDLDSAKTYSYKALNLGKKVNSKNLKIRSLICLAYFKEENSEYAEALNLLEESLTLSKK